jgi:WXXGXW repeat (2 copies)
MHLHTWQRKLIPAGLLMSALLSGCVIAPARPYYAADDEVVMAAPPPPQQEYIGVAPAVGYVWLGGYWGWTGRSHVWVGGHWDAPRGGQRWMPHTWIQMRGGWHLRPGHWERG